MVANRIKVKLFAANQDQLKTWKKELLSEIETALSVIGVEMSTDIDSSGDLVFLSDGRDDFEKIIKKHSGDGKAIILVTQRGDSVSKHFLSGKVDDVLVEPFRKIEILSKLKAYQEILRWDEVRDVNQSFASVIHNIKEDLELAERLQQNRMPKRWPKIQGFQIHSKYFSGLKSGGDYFDLFESKDKKRVSMFLSDSSSYGLSSAVLGSFMKIASRVAVGQKQESHEVVKLIEDDLKETLGPKEKLSLVFGFVSRKDLAFNLVHLGNSKVFLYRKSAGLAEVKSQGVPISEDSKIKIRKSKILKLRPSDRIVLLSEGAWKNLGSEKANINFLFDSLKKQPKGFLNDVSFKLQEKFQKNEDQMPPQDCTTLIIDIASNVIRLKQAG